MVGPRSPLDGEAGGPQVPRDGWPGAIQGNRQEDVRISDVQEEMEPETMRPCWSFPVCS